MKNNLVGSVQNNRWNKLTAWMWRIIRLFYSNIHIQMSNDDDDIYICTSAVCVIGVSAKADISPIRRQKGISIYGILSSVTPEEARSKVFQ
jgi:hypothetical protein